MRRTLPRCIRAMGVVGLCICAGVLDACDKSAGAPAGSQAPPPAPVTVARATQEDAPLLIPAIGWVESRESVTIRPQIEGQLTEVHFTEGQDLHKGELLFTIDARPFEAALASATAMLAKDRAMSADAQREVRRLTDLFDRQIATDRETQSAQALADAQAAQVDADQAAVDRAKLQLDYCKIRSPLDGRAGARLTDVGNIVKAHETELVVVNRIVPIDVVFSVPEQHLNLIRSHADKGALTVFADIGDGTDHREKGELTFIDNLVDRSTGMIRLKGTFSNDDRHLWPGQYVNVQLNVLEQPNAIVVPAAAVQTGQSGLFVFVVQSDQTVEVRPVTTGRTFGTRTIVLKGVSAGETVVTDGQLRLAPGSHVQIKTGLDGTSATTQPMRSPAAAET